MKPLCPILISGTVQNYPWGRAADKSVIPRLVERFEPTLPQAELWIGAHPKSPSTASFGGERAPLNQLLLSYPSFILGDEVMRRFKTLPFLFKVLSIGSALSIQAHPDKMLARELHARDPKNYPDANHKPEVGIALSAVRLLYGFRSLSEIAGELQSLPELRSLIGDSISSRILACHGADNDLLRAAYTSLVRSESSIRAKAVEQILRRIKDSARTSSHDELLVELSSVCELKDIGLLSLYLMNLCTLEAGTAVFIAENVPHAYISGELVECMANSDNVVRAGLTTKYQDVDTLLSMITYRSETPTIVRPVADEVVPTLFRYNLNVAEFDLAEIQGAGSYGAETSNRPALLFCLDGKVEVVTPEGELTLMPGRAALVPAGCEKYLIHSHPTSRAFLVTVPE